MKEELTSVKPPKISGSFADREKGRNINISTLLGTKASKWVKKKQFFTGCTFSKVKPLIATFLLNKRRRRNADQFTCLWRRMEGEKTTYNAKLNEKQHRAATSVICIFIIQQLKRLMAPSISSLLCAGLDQNCSPLCLLTEMTLSRRRPLRPRGRLTVL